MQTHPLSSETPSPSQSPGPAPCAVEEVPAGPLFYAWSVYRSIPTSQFMPPSPLHAPAPAPPQVHSLSLHFCSYRATRKPFFLSPLTPCIDHTACVTHTGLLWPTVSNKSFREAQERHLSCQIPGSKGSIHGQFKVLTRVLYPFVTGMIWIWMKWELWHFREWLLPWASLC